MRGNSSLGTELGIRWLPEVHVGVKLKRKRGGEVFNHALLPGEDGVLRNEMTYILLSPDYVLHAHC